MKNLRINLRDEQKLLDFELRYLAALEKLILGKFPERFQSADDFQIDVAIVTDEEIKNLNRDYRHKDYVTDVLSFAYEESSVVFPVSGEAKPLGEIMISFDQVKRQAVEFKTGVEKEFYLLLIHGILHLLGYDHMEDEEAAEMEMLEDQILRTLFNL
ncbi:MAG TPA: rRNA maturation RNase YbeY [bacterium]|nr:rRNA maturation RNase YbeY [bacterium]